MKEFLALIGFVTLWAIGFGIVMFVYYTIQDGVHEWKRRYRYKHRFDKPPTAECYCIDCKRHNNESGICHKFNWTTADNWFCWDAEPRMDIE